MSRDQAEPAGIDLDRVEVAGILDLTQLLPELLDGWASDKPLVFIDGASAGGSGSALADWFLVPPDSSTFLVPPDSPDGVVPPGRRPAC